MPVNIFNKIELHRPVSLAHWAHDY